MTLLTDDRGSVVGVTEAGTGQVAEKLHYNMTGLCKAFTGGDAAKTRPDNASFNLGRSGYVPFGYLGMYHDPFTGLYHTHFREYDAIHGRWLSEDPAGYADGLNLYQAYMGVNGTDPLGLNDEDKELYAWLHPYCTKSVVEATDKIDAVGKNMARGMVEPITAGVDIFTNTVTPAIVSHTGWDLPVGTSLSFMYGKGGIVGRQQAVEKAFRSSGMGAFDAYMQSGFYSAADLMVLESAVNAATGKQIAFNGDEIAGMNTLSGTDRVLQGVEAVVEGVVVAGVASPGASYLDDALTAGKQSVNVVKNNVVRVADDIPKTIKLGGCHDDIIRYKIRPDITPVAGTRNTAIDRAWKLEQELVRKTGRGTRTWNPSQAQELLDTGTVKGFTGHHINNVADFPDWTGDPRNIRFLPNSPGGGEHLQGLQGHRGSYRNPTRGRLIDRQAMLDRITN